MSQHTGLKSHQALAFANEFGPNETLQRRVVSRWAILVGQFKSPVIGLIFGACIISGLVSDLVDAIAIGSIMIVNAVVGFFQEYRADPAVMALRDMTAP